MEEKKSIEDKLDEAVGGRGGAEAAMNAPIAYQKEMEAMRAEMMEKMPADFRQKMEEAKKDLEARRVSLDNGSDTKNVQ